MKSLPSLMYLNKTLSAYTEVFYENYDILKHHEIKNVIVGGIKVVPSFITPYYYNKIMDSREYAFKFLKFLREFIITYYPEFRGQTLSYYGNYTNLAHVDILIK